MATQKDIARALGIKQPHVSMALKNHPSVSKETCKRVQQVAKELGYRANAALSEAAASRWKQSDGRRRETVAFLATKYQSQEKDFPILEATERRLDELGYGMQRVYPLEYSSESQLSRSLYNQGIRGIILEQQRMEDRKRALQWEKFIVVQAGILTRDFITHMVMVDFPGMVDELLRRLLEAGYDRVAFILAEPNEYYSDYLIAQAVIGATRLQYFGALKSKIITVRRKEIRPTALQSAIRRFDPQALVFNPFEELLDSLKPFSMPKVALLGDHYNDAYPGFDSQFELLGTYTAELLDSRLRSHDYGIPENPYRKVFVPPWNAAVELPKRSADC